MEKSSSIGQIICHRYTKVTKLQKLLSFLDLYLQKDPAATSKISVLVHYPGVHAILYHRIAQNFTRKRDTF